MSERQLLFQMPLNSTERHQWLMDLSDDLRNGFISKYLRGAKEHDGDLGGITLTALLQEAGNETLDQMAYLAEITRRIEAMASTIAAHRIQTHELIKIIAQLMDGHAPTDDQQVTIDETKEQYGIN